jgi:hypothetical protein
VAEIVSGESIGQVAERWGLPKATVICWWREERPIEPDNARAREALAGLVYGALSDLLVSVRVQLQAFTREEWLAQQTAGEAAALLGTEIDRAVRLLAGFRPAEHAAIAELDAGNDVDAEPESHRNGAVDPTT